MFRVAKVHYFFNFSSFEEFFLRYPNKFGESTIAFSLILETAFYSLKKHRMDDEGIKNIKRLEPFQKY
jgi:hypothetical protein